MTLTTTAFQQVCQALLQRHYGLDLTDTQLGDAQYVRDCIERGESPSDVLRDLASEFEWHRIDREGPWGEPDQTPIDADDEACARAGVEGDSRPRPTAKARA